MLHSRDVIFNEYKYGFESSRPQKESERHVYLEHLDEPLEPPAPPRQSGHEHKQPDYYGFQCSTGESEVKELKSMLLRAFMSMVFRSWLNSHKAASVLAAREYLK